MNKPNHSIPPAYMALPKPSPAGSPAESATATMEDIPSPRPVLFPVRSKVCEITVGQTSIGPSITEAPPSSAPGQGQWRDRGLWLLHDAFIRREGWSQLSAMPAALPFPHRTGDRRYYAMAKRTVDLVGSIALLALLSPLLFLVALLVRLDSPGPAVFRQRRVGKDGEEFLLWKFRSMYVDAPEYARSPTSNMDPRLTRIGRLIRRVSIDELPQLVNVLKGEMSLVGPRPEMPFIVDTYTKLERGRLSVKPGITGLWQVSPARALPIHENLQYDLHYIHHQNLSLDGAILLRTIAAVIRGVGAV